MSGKDNLIPIQSRSTEEQREIQSKGGVASGRSRKQRASMREALNVLLAAPVKDKATKEELKKSGAGEMNTNSLLALRLLQQALNGDMQAAKLLLTAIGEADPAALEIADAKIDLAYLRLEKETAIIEDVATNLNFFEALNANGAEFWKEDNKDE
jgi:hypothetical protein